MSNRKAYEHVQKGTFALMIGIVMMLLYQKWNVIDWLIEKDNVIITILVVIGPLIAVTEIAFLCCAIGKSKLAKMLDSYDET